MSRWERTLFYARKSFTGIGIAAAIGYLSFKMVERQKDTGMTAEWVEKHTPLPGTEENIKRQIQKEAWFDAIFQDIPDEQKERVTRRWTGKSYLEEKRKREQNLDKLVLELKKEQEKQ